MTRLAILGCVVENGMISPDPDRYAPPYGTPCPLIPESSEEVPGPFFILCPVGT